MSIRLPIHPVAPTPSWYEYERPELVPFKELAGVPVHWASWGNRGTRLLERRFHVQVTEALEHLFQIHPAGRPDGILSGGAYVPDTVERYGRHALGAAFDLSGIQWGSRRFRFGPLVKSQQPKKSLAVEAVARVHVPQVLGQWADDNHVSHQHWDNRKAADGFQPTSPNDVRFLQAALIHVWGLDPGSIDGRIGPRTLVAVCKAMDQIEQPETIERPEVWREFLLATARGGLGVVELTSHVSSPRGT